MFYKDCVYEQGHDQPYKISCFLKIKPVGLIQTFFKDPDKNLDIKLKRTYCEKTCNLAFYQQAFQSQTYFIC